MTVDYSQPDRQASFLETSEKQVTDSPGEREPTGTQERHCLDDDALRCCPADREPALGSESDVIEGYFNAGQYANSHAPWTGSGAGQSNSVHDTSESGNRSGRGDSGSENPLYPLNSRDFDGISEPRHFRLDSIPPESYGPESLPSLAAKPVFSADSAVRSGIVLNALSLTITMGLVVWWAVQYYDRLQERAILAQMGEQMSLSAQMIRELQLRDGQSSLEAARENEPESGQIRTQFANLRVSKPHKREVNSAPKRSSGRKKDIRNIAPSQQKPKSDLPREKKPQLGSSRPADASHGPTATREDSPNTASQSGASEGEDEIATPTKEQVKQVMAAIAPAIKNCGQGRGGRIRLKMAASGASGRVIKAEVMDEDIAGTPIATCVTKAIRSARFPLFSQRLLVIKYPFEI